MPFPSTCALESPECRKDYPVFLCQQNVPSEHVITLYNSDQTPYVLDNGTQTVELDYADRFGRPTQDLLHQGIPVTITDGPNGVITIPFTDEELPDGGLFVGQITVIEDQGGELISVAQFPCYVEVQRDLRVHNTNNAAIRPVNLADIRLAMRDKCSEDNYLLDNVQFTDHEIAWAMERPLDYW